MMKDIFSTGRNIFFLFFGVILILGTVFIGYGLYSFKSSDAYQFAKEYVLEDPEIGKKVGGVTGFGFMVGGEISPNKAHLSFSVKGKNSDVGVIFDLSKEHETWVIDKKSYY